MNFKDLTPEQKAELLQQASPQELKASLSAKENKTQQDRKAYKDLVNTTIPSVITTIKNVSKNLSELKFGIFESLSHLLELKNEAYDVKNDQQSHTFSDDQGNTIVYGYRVNDGWDDTVNAGISKVYEALSEIVHDENARKTIDILLKKDAKGNLKASRVLELRQMAETFQNSKFNDAVEIIAKAYKPVRSAFFIEAYETNAQGKKVGIPLSMTAVDFPEGTNIEELFPIPEKENKNESV